ncbi:hypothetical protein OIDMADRAFT_56956 [Oidiodendron maius Zn]|uniref:HNH nuclease domain-containing protein n=1 Tax=Oidiodendron maius (strain Zn) TaxID=913774 RepID=A0A0C3H8D3_OIDMZ|nr:hypothetical protein OIDMADRAFT_56956 [Oidiodendron maius Zn]
MEDFNVPTAERVALLEQLQEAMGGAPPYFWAACQICDIKALEDLVEHACRFPEAAYLVALHAHTMILHWSQKPGGLSRTPSQASTPAPSHTSTPAPSLPSTPKKRNLAGLSSSPIDFPPAKRQKTTDDIPSSLLSRNKMFSEMAKERDNFQCVLTGDGSNEAAHIYPYCAVKNKEEDPSGPRHIFWNCLKLFWPKEKVAAWTTELFPQGINELGVERVDNLITLSKSAHSYWNQGAFAFKPISINEDKTTLKIQFFWQNKQNTEAKMSLSTVPYSTEGLDHNEGAFKHGTIKLFSHSRESYIISGDIFELKTDDVIARPLPSFQLLEMQWFLTRIVGMAGAAFPYGYEDWDYDSDGEVSNLGLDEVGDDSLPLADPILPETPEFVRKDNLLFTKASEHHREEMEGDRVGVGSREHE